MITQEYLKQTYKKCPVCRERMREQHDMLTCKNKHVILLQSCMSLETPQGSSGFGIDRHVDGDVKQYGKEWSQPDKVRTAQAWDEAKTIQAFNSWLERNAMLERRYETEGWSTRGMSEIVVCAPNSSP